MATARASEVSLYNGHPTIKIYTGRKYKDEEEFIAMGYSKASAVCDQIDYIRRFVDQVERKKL